MKVSAKELYIVHNEIYSELYNITGDYEIIADKIEKIGERVFRVKNPKIKLPKNEKQDKISLDGEYILRIQVVITHNRPLTIITLTKIQEEKT